MTVETVRTAGVEAVLLAGIPCLQSVPDDPSVTVIFDEREFGDQALATETAAIKTKTDLHRSGNPLISGSPQRRL